MVRGALRDNGALPVRVFLLTKVAREGGNGEVFLGRKELIFQPGKMKISCTSTIQFFPSLVRSPPRFLVCWSGD